MRIWWRIVDSFGAFSKETAELVKTMRAGADGSLFRTFSSSTAGSAVSVLAICLQKGNAYVARISDTGSEMGWAKNFSSHPEICHQKGSLVWAKRWF